jgi:hypothetical protein
MRKHQRIKTFCACVLLWNFSSIETTAFQTQRSYGDMHVHRNSDSLCYKTESSSLPSTSLSAKGFAGTNSGGFGSKSQTKAKPPSKQAVMKKLQKAYGGTSPQEIAEATQRRVELTIQNLPPHLHMAVQLYKQIKQWDAQMARLSILQQANVNEQDVQERNEPN